MHVSHPQPGSSPTGDVDGAGPSRARGNTVSTTSSSPLSAVSGRLRSSSVLSASRASTTDTLPSSLGSYEPSTAYQAAEASPRLPALTEGSGTNQVVPERLTEASRSTSERSLTRFFARSRSAAQLDGEGSSRASSATPKRRRFGLRSHSVDQLQGTGAEHTPLQVPGSLPSASTSTSSFRPPASPYLSSPVGSPLASRQSSTTNLPGPISPRQRMIRRLSNLPLGRSRASSLSFASPAPPSQSSRSPSPLPPPQRPSNRHRSASEPLRSMLTTKPMPGIDFFSLLLPRELRLLIFSTLLRVCIDDLEATQARAEWHGERARTQRWAGRNAGIRELVKCSGVSKSWHALAFDSQLWLAFEVPIIGNDVVSTPGMLRMLSSAWSLRRLDLTGMANLEPAGMIALADATATFSNEGFAQNGLELITLTGCRSLTVNALHYLIGRSPHVRELRLPALKAVTNMLIDLLASTVDDLRLLDVNRCTNVAGRSILRLAGVHGRLRDLRVAGIRLLDDEVLAGIGLAFPELEHLDLRWSLSITNAGVKAFVRDKRITRLRHLALSSCPRLSDAALESLSSTCPDLTTLELGSFGERIQGPGLISLIKTTPHLARLDLDGATALPDRVLSHLTTHCPDLRHIIFSGCSTLTERALLHYVRAFKQGGTFELDGTAASESVVREAGLKRRAKEVVAVDCRAVGRSLPSDIAAASRARRGVRGWRWREVDYHDDERVGPREMDESRVVVKTFGAYAQLDAADAARTTRRGQASEAVKNEGPKRPWLRGRSRSEACVVS